MSTERALAASSGQYVCHFERNSRTCVIKSQVLLPPATTASSVVKSTRTEILRIVTLSRKCSVVSLDKSVKVLMIFNCFSFKWPTELRALFQLIKGCWKVTDTQWSIRMTAITLESSDLPTVWMTLSSSFLCYSFAMSLWMKYSKHIIKAISAYLKLQSMLLLLLQSIPVFFKKIANIFIWHWKYSSYYTHYIAMNTVSLSHTAV